VTLPAEATRDAALLRRGRGLEAATLAWNLVGIVILAVAALRAHSVALAGFGLDSLIEIGASTVVLWELSGTGEERNGGRCASSPPRSSRWPATSPSRRSSSSPPATTPSTARVIVYYALKEARAIYTRHD